MSDQTAGVAPGALSGINLTGADEELDNVPEATLPAEDDRTLAGAAAEATEAPEPEPEPADDPEFEDAVPTPEPGLAPEFVEPVEPVPAEPEPEPTAPEPEAPTTVEETAAVTEPTEGKKSGAPIRKYVILREVVADGKVGYERPDGKDSTEHYTVDARNGNNAMRAAFRDLTSNDTDLVEATLVVIPLSQFKPTPVRLSRSERVSVQMG